MIKTELNGVSDDFMFNTTDLEHSNDAHENMITGENRPIAVVQKQVKNDSPQRHRGHREELFIVNCAAGVANNKS